MNARGAGFEMYKRRVEFDRRKRRRRTKREQIGYTLLGGAPNERRIKATVDRYARAGWWYVARKENEGFLGFGAHTLLMFQR